MEKDVKARHTPGPWKVYRTTDGQQILGIGQEGTGAGVTDPRFGLWSDGEEREANARLIAAAPELLEALIRMVRDGDDVSRSLGFGPVKALEGSSLEAARAAISKATGGES